MSTLGASEVAKLFHEFGQQTAFRGGNPYRARILPRLPANSTVNCWPEVIRVTDNSTTIHYHSP